MSKQIIIEVPDWVDKNLANKLKSMLVTKLREEIERDYTDIRLYSLYLMLRFPETKNTNFDLNKELETLRQIREKERKRVKCL